MCLILINHISQLRRIGELVLTKEAETNLLCDSFVPILCII
jgi:hypothetical protein